MINDEIIKNHQTIYIHGKTNTRKTTTVKNFLIDNKYDYSYEILQKIKNSGDFINLLLNKNILFTMTSSFNKKKKKVVIIDNIDYLQNVDKKTIGNIIKVIKDKNFIDKYRHACIIFIGINNHDKKVLELMNIVSKVIKVEDSTKNDLEYDQCMKATVKDCLDKTYDTNKIHNEKTIISLCYHENIINYINNDTIFYEKFLNNFTIGDYYDRLSFQKQLWQFNEMTFYLKFLVNHHMYLNNTYENIKDNDIIFTKILTKYSNEFSNLNFVINICNKLNIQKEEIYNHISTIKDNHVDKLTPVEVKRIRKLFSL